MQDQIEIDESVELEYEEYYRELEMTDAELSEQKAWDSYYSEIEQKNEEFKAKWPNYCKKCGGWGMHSYTEMHGFNYGCGEQMAEPCECVEEGICPRCGKEAGFDDEGQGPCQHCGWNYDDGLAS